MVDVGPLENRRRKQKWHSGYSTRKEAEQALICILERIAQGNHIEESNITLGEFLRQPEASA